MSNDSVLIIQMLKVLDMKTNMLDIKEVYTFIAKYVEEDCVLYKFLIKGINNFD